MFIFLIKNDSDFLNEYEFVKKILVVQFWSLKIF